MVCNNCTMDVVPTHIRSHGEDCPFEKPVMTNGSQETKEKMLSLINNRRSFEAEACGSFGYRILIYKK